MSKIKAAFKNVICFILYYGGITGIAMRHMLPKIGKLPVIILIYHRIVRDTANDINANITINHPESNFVSEMRFLKENCDIVDLDSAVNMIKNNVMPQRPTVAVTFDDGFSDNYKLAFPVLREMGIPATIFLTAGYIGTNKLPWVERLGQSILNTEEKELRLDSDFNYRTFTLGSLSEKRGAFDRISSELKELNNTKRAVFVNEIVQKLKPDGNGFLKMLNWSEIYEMSKDNIAFGPHTMTHPILSRMPVDEAKEEIRQSKAVIEKELGIQAKHFAYPNGRPEDFTEDLRSYCRELGFDSVSTAVYGNNTPGSDEFALRRISPGKNMPVFAVDLMRGFLRK